MAPINAPTALVAVVASAILNPVIQFVVEEIRRWRTDNLEDKEAVEQWSNDTRSFARNLGLLWETQYIGHDPRKRGGASFRTDLVNGNNRLHSQTQSKPDSIDDEVHEALIELLRLSRGLENKLPTATLDPGDVREQGDAMREQADTVVKLL